jgi:hypothetical protein
MDKLEENAIKNSKITLEEFLNDFYSHKTNKGVS